MGLGLVTKRVCNMATKLIDVAPITGAYIAVSFVAASTIVDVFMRYFLNSPIRGVIETNTLLLPVIVYLGLAATQRSRRHIRVNILIMHLPPRAQLVLETGVFVLAFSFVFVMGLQALEDAMMSRAIHQVMFGTDPPIATFPFKFVLPIGLWLFCFQYLKDIAKNVALLKVKVPVLLERRAVEGEGV